jgi:hypothetical protein
MSKNMRKELEIMLKDLEATADDIEGSAATGSHGLSPLVSLLTAGLWF